MNDTFQPPGVPILPVGKLAWSPERRSEPVTIGIPFPVGAAMTPGEIWLEAQDGKPSMIQARPLDLWPDGSIRWALVDCLVDCSDGRAKSFVLRLGSPPPPTAGLRVVSTQGAVRIDTGRAVFGFAIGGSFPVSEVVAEEGPRIDAERSGLQIEIKGVVHRFRIAEVRLDERGPLRAAIELRGESDQRDAALPLEVTARVEAFSASANLRVAITVRNTRRASHPGGRWPLGDQGSVLLDSAVLALGIAGQVSRVRCAPEPGADLADAQVPFEIHQESSGGENWNGPVHRNRDGRVAPRFKGYRFSDARGERAGSRANPIVVVENADGQMAIAVPKFWENFPRSIKVTDALVEIGLFPRQSEDLHELQGGEQKTHVVVLAFAPDRVSDPPLAWVHDPALAYPTPEWCCKTGAVPFLVPASLDRDRAYLDLVQTAFDPSAGFLAKREMADEYGWRDFGDLPADHESAFQPPDQPFVSHYNNQYDAIACFAIHFLRTGDRRWWQLMVDLAQHVRDIDIYHTTEDKAAYNGGLFWHTAHYFDAGTSTHRTYPKDGPASGGPSAEHNYNAGLMLHHFLTGEPASRRDAVQLGEWVIAMDDGRQTVFRWLASGATGLASGSGSIYYHGPGRGAGNSILACLVAFRLSGDRKFMATAEGLIRRCIHPADDITARDLLNAEQRWFYTIFLQVLGVYLHGKTERREFDQMFFYARESLLHYARWILDHERPYLDHAEQLEYPTETWPAQDLRKADVLFWAAAHADIAEREAFLTRAHFFRDYSIATVAAMPNHKFTRPTVLMLANGARMAWFQAPEWGPRLESQAPAPESVDQPVAFEPQKIRAIRHAKWAVIVSGLVLALVVFAFIVAGH